MLALSPMGVMAAETDAAQEDAVVVQEESTAGQSAAAEESGSAKSEDTVAASTETSGTCGENVTWKLDKGVLTISGSGQISDYIGNGDSPFQRTDIKKIVIQNGVTSIGWYAFAGCSALTSVTIPVSVTSIGWNAFANCSVLKDVYYTGTAEQWKKIKTVRDTDVVTGVTTIHYTIPVESVVLSKESHILSVGESFSLTATVSPDNATDKSITWKSSDTSVATVDQSGKVTAVKAGTATITATSNNGKSASCQVMVSDSLEAIRVSISPNSLSLSSGESFQLKATIFPDNVTDKTIKWMSSDTSVATVDQNGKVHASMSEWSGTTKISATASNGVCSTIVVTVRPPEVQSVTLSKTSLSLAVVGQEDKLIATVVPSQAPIIWESSNDAVAAVDQHGTVTAIGVGTATITAKGYNKKGASCTVNVLASSTSLDLQWGRDTFSFLNSKDDVFGFWNSVKLPDNPPYKYPSDTEIDYSLINNSSFTPKDKDAMKRDWDAWNGNCFGMSYYACLNFEKKVKPSDLQTGAANLYDLSALLYPWWVNPPLPAGL